MAEALTLPIAFERLKVRGRLSRSRVCRGCGQPFVWKGGGRNKGRYCSRACAYAHIGEWSRPGKGRPAGTRRIVIRVGSCVACGVCGRCTRKGGPLCAVCLGLLNRARLLVRVWARRAALRATRPIFMVACRECGREFAGGGQRRRFCSLRCQWRLHKRIDKRVRRARERVTRIERFDPVDVFVRDRWRCQLCGVATPKRLRGTMDARAPELDHIVPLAAGGSHTYDNGQCACRTCNGNKSARVRGQLRLAL